MQMFEEGAAIFRVKKLRGSGALVNLGAEWCSMIPIAASMALSVRNNPKIHTS